MSQTWQDVRREILTLLDVDPNATTDSDIRRAVDFELEHTRLSLYADRPPLALFRTSSTVIVDEDTEGINIAASATTNVPSFLLSDFWYSFALVIEGEEWEFVEYPTWLRQVPASAGNQRLPQSWTINQSNRIILSGNPSSGTTWEAQLHYIAEPTVITDGGIPELPREHRGLLILSIVTMFPQRFQTDERLALLASLNTEKERLRRKFMMATTNLARSGRMRPFVRKYRSSSTIWGDGMF